MMQLHKRLAQAANHFDWPPERPKTIYAEGKMLSVFHPKHRTKESSNSGSKQPLEI
jgi:hypothetical protein